MNPIYNSSIRKTYNISGKKGDVYNVSFWYKNEGLYASGLVGVNQDILSYNLYAYIN